MRKIIIIFTLFLICANLSSQDLWNGFKENMTVAEVKQLGKTKFGTSARDVTNSYEDTMNSVYGEPKIIKLNPYNVDYEKNNEFYNSEFVSYPDTVIGFRSSDPVYNQNTYKTWANIHFFFIDNKLYAIEVRWSLSFADIIPSSIDKYGNEYKTEVVVHSPVDYWKSPTKVRFYHWSKNNIEVFLAEESDVNYDHGNPLYVISTKGIKESLEKKQTRDKNLQNEKDQYKENLKNSLVY
ncbi:MAG: hypothetical protein SPE48_08795 [Treponema porcinum]|uniref:hypothetical protein n=1 Tax=Treponema porcinum TaxID=261392 RepID=UPI002A7F45F0|nr:hypothetical protein [Treponema porcinum]MDY5121984.1 hypothetical protein [Treponema porcinum]